jgi:hypothetical protein
MLKMRMRSAGIRFERNMSFSAPSPFDLQNNVEGRKEYRRHPPQASSINPKMEWTQEVWQ